MSNSSALRGMAKLRILLVWGHLRGTIIRAMPTFSFAAGEKQLRWRLERAASFGSIQTEQDW